MAAAAALMCAAAIALVVVVFPLADYRDNDSTDPAEESVEVIARETEVPQPADADLEWSPSRDVRVGELAGRITALYVEPSVQVACGSRVLGTDGRDVVALCGPTPPWRPIDSTTIGPDADGLAELLVAADLLDETQRSNGTARSAAWAAFQTQQLGVEATGIFQPADVIWIGEALTPNAVTVAVGDILVPDAVVMSVLPRVLSVRVTAADGSSLSAQRTFAFDGDTERFAIGPDGELDPNALRAGQMPTLLAPPGEPPPRSVPGTSFLLEPSSVWAVPASAIITTSTSKLCVLRRRSETVVSPVAVRVADSSVGTALVEGDFAAGDAVVVRPLTSATC